MIMAKFCSFEDFHAIPAAGDGCRILLDLHTLSDTSMERPLMRLAAVFASLALLSLPTPCVLALTEAESARIESLRAVTNRLAVERKTAEALASAEQLLKLRQEL